MKIKQLVIFGKLRDAWMKFAFALAWVNTRLLLSIVYFIVLPPIAIGLRLFGKDYLHLGKRQNGSYWLNKEPVDKSINRQRRQF
jgi:hypothetical protein